jgi:phosphatidate phosphatase LPIN
MFIPQKSLNLKPGPNSITFSLSTSGTIACTARIFVWESTDLVLVSDIDGTITKCELRPPPAVPD